MKFLVKYHFCCFKNLTKIIVKVVQNIFKLNFPHTLKVIIYKLILDFLKQFLKNLFFSSRSIIRFIILKYIQSYLLKFLKEIYFYKAKLNPKQQFHGNFEH